jgi:hypothetical protein
LGFYFLLSSEFCELSLLISSYYIEFWTIVFVIEKITSLACVLPYPKIKGSKLQKVGKEKEKSFNDRLLQQNPKIIGKFYEDAILRHVKDTARQY